MNAQRARQIATNMRADAMRLSDELMLLGGEPGPMKVLKFVPTLAHAEGRAYVWEFYADRLEAHETVTAAALFELIGDSVQVAHVYIGAAYDQGQRDAVREVIERHGLA